MVIIVNNKKLGHEFFQGFLMPAVMSVGLVGNLLSIRVLKSTNIDMKVRYSSTSTFGYETFRENTRATQWVTFSGTVPKADNSLWRESLFFARIFALIFAFLLWVDGLVFFFDKIREPLHQMWWRCQVSGWNWTSVSGSVSCPPMWNLVGYGMAT